MGTTDTTGTVMTGTPSITSLLRVRSAWPRVSFDAGPPGVPGLPADATPILDATTAPFDDPGAPTPDHPLSVTRLRRLSGHRPPLQARQHHYFEASVDRTPSATALIWEGGAMPYAELDARANQVAHLLLARGVRPGARVGLLVPRSPELYAGLLGIQKAGAAWVPIDPESPPERVDYISTDAGLDALVAVSGVDRLTATTTTPVIRLDAEETALAAQPTTRPVLAVEGDPTAYVIYTSGSTGRPKGVDIAQSSICNFVHVITEVYDVRPADRVYQGMIIAFDFAIEEVWPTWAAGAALVAGPLDGRRLGEGLADFLQTHRVSVLYCVPTVLSTLERDLPALRSIMVGGEACPAELVERWARGRTMLNTYGPTETTVTCTWGVLQPGRPVTIGIPVPTYTAAILDEDRRAVPDGEVGELCIGGPGVARGYLNRPDLTRDRFIPDPADPSRRIYRTGDLARVGPDGEIVYLGRADAEVKIRGHRVDLGEIESIIMRDPDVRTAAVTFLPSENGGDLAAFLVPARPIGADAADLLRRVHTTVRQSAPAYMVPAFVDVLDELPMMPSGKVNRKALPAPAGPRLVGGDLVAAATPTEEWMRDEWAALLGLEPTAVSVTADFFEDLGGHSLLAAGATSRLRHDPRAAAMSVLDLYAHPSVRRLAAFLDETGGAAATPAERTDRAPRTRRLRRFGFGGLQLGAIYLNVLIAMLPIALLYWWHSGIPSMRMLQSILLSFPISYLTGRWLVPILVARLAGAGLTPGRYRLYGAVHLRVWLVAKAMELAPLDNLAGSPYAAAYLRACGARIGERVHLGTAQIGLPSLVTLDDDATVGYATHLECAAVTGGWLEIGPIRLGPGATVAANSVLTGPCSMGAGSFLDAQSLLGAHEDIPDGEIRQGSPAERRDDFDDPIFATMRDCGRAPREWPAEVTGLFRWGLLTLEFVPMVSLLPAVLVIWWALLTGTETAALLMTLATGPLFVLTAMVVILGLRRFGLEDTPPGIHHLRSRLGAEKWFADKLLEQSLKLTNTLYATLYTAPWLRALGARIGRRAEVSTIANIDPDLLTLGDESFVADMGSVGSASYANGHCAFRPTRTGRRSFVGNAAFIPSGTELGDDSLIGVGSTPPRGGVPAGTSWLGSPPIYLPRREVYEDFGDAQTFDPPRSKVIGRYLIEYVRIVLPSTLLALSTFATLHVASLLGRAGASAAQLVAAVPAVALLGSLATVLLVAALKWIVVGRYRPRVEPLWSWFVRRTEFVTGIYEGASVPALLQVLTGTPMLGPLLRLYGVRVGRGALLDTTYVTEFDLVRIADDATVGRAVSLQTHLFEDRVMKMHEVRIGRGADVGTRAVVLYDTRVGDGVSLAPLSLVMKGEQLPAATAWCGIPARPTRRRPEPEARHAPNSVV